MFNTGVGLKEGDPDPHWQLVARERRPELQAAARPGANWPMRGTSLPDDPARIAMDFGRQRSVSVPEGHVHFPHHVRSCRLAAETAVLKRQVHGRRPCHRHSFERAESGRAQTALGRAVHLLGQFTVGEGFVAGANVLEIDVLNENPNRAPNDPRRASPMALRLELQGSAVARRRRLRPNAAGKEDAIKSTSHRMREIRHVCAARGWSAD